MKIEQPIDERLWKALNHVTNYVNHTLEEEEDYKYMDGLEDSLALVSEYASCFGADGRVSQRGTSPSAWKQETIFESWEEPLSLITEEASAEQKDANAKKLLEELT